MNIGPYKLAAQLGAGRDGVAYRAQDPADGNLVEVRVLSGARADDERWRLLSRRLQRAAVLEHPVALRLSRLDLDDSPPYVAVEWLEGEQPWHGLPMPGADALELAHDLAGGLAAAHRLGLVHGEFGPAAVRFTATRLPRIDFTGVDVQVPDDDPLRDVEASCRAPELSSGGTADSAADVYALGALLFWVLTGRPVTRSPAGEVDLRNDITWPSCPSPALVPLLREMLSSEPVQRPWAKEVATRLTEMLESSVPSAEVRRAEEASVTVMSELLVIPPPPLSGRSPHEQRGRDRLLAQFRPPDVSNREMLGRFQLLEQLGQGGMGTVFRAEDLADGSIVAIKVMLPEMASDQGALRRFYKEARLLAEVNHPCVTNLLEVNEDEGIHYLVLEFVPGRSLRELMEERGRLDEPTALALVAEVARGLEVAHERGVVHRDVKPDNILLVDALPRDAKFPPGTRPRLKLSDFGLARQVRQSDSLRMTHSGDAVGTPLYMAPEQINDSTRVDPRTDVYALGATLFHMLAGRPPFMGPSPTAVMTMHCNDPVPSLQGFNPDVSEGVCQVVIKALAKAPEARYANAAELRQDCERLLRGEPTSIAIHPRLPTCDPAKVVSYVWNWDLDASPEQLWPYVTNTDRLNRAVGLSAVEFKTQEVSGASVRRLGQFRKMGLTVAWQEHPFEWVELQRMGVLREYSQGPFKWLRAVIELAPRSGGGTRLTHHIEVEPRSLLGRAVAAVEVGLKGYQALDRVCRRMDAALTGKLGNAAALDPFEEPVALADARRQRLDRCLDRLLERQVEPLVVERLGDFLAQAPAQEVARIRPLALARRLDVDPEKMVAACLLGAREGLLVLLWDILCPVCRIPSEVKDSLRALRAHGHCAACNLRFEVDFAHSVEMIFRAHPEVRDAELSTYCIGGPAYSPHVVAQVRVDPGERVELALALREGTYRLCGPQLPVALTFRVQEAAATSRWDLSLARGLDPELPRSLKAGRQLLVLTNDHQQELLARVERTALREDVLSAARASTLALFREMFPEEVLAPGNLVSVATVTLLVTSLERAGLLYEELGDVTASALLYEHFRMMEERLRSDGGALVKIVGDGLWACFSEPVAALRVALALPTLLTQREATQRLRLKIGIHRGPAVVATLHDHLDYLGATANQALHLLQLAHAGELLLTQSVAADPQVVALLRQRRLEGIILAESLPGLAEPIQRLVLSEPTSA